MTAATLARARTAAPITARMTSRQLSTSALVSMTVRLIGPASAFLLAILLARALGVVESGVFFVALTLVTACAIVAKFGMETALQRFVGAELGHGKHTAVAGVYRQSLAITFALALGIGALVTLAAEPLARALLGDPTQVATVRLLGMVILPFTLLGVFSAMLKAVGRPTWGGFFEAAAWPLLALSLVGISVVQGELTTIAAAQAYVLAAVFAATTAWIVLQSQLPRGLRAQAMPAKTLYRSGFALTGIELMNFALLWLPFVLLPALADPGEAGLYNVAHRLAAQLGLLMLALASITAARFAAQHAREQQTELRQLAGRSTRLLILFGLPPAAVLFIWGDDVLSVFGKDYADAEAALRILLVGQLFNLATGPVGYLLTMTGHEHQLRKVLFATLALMLPLALVLIPAFGATGAAATVAIAMAFQNLACCRLVSTRLELPFVLAFAR